ncbi:hypothetical protein Q3G72_028981 [Acer saccharum]|nr:hypothetical protein Q3G72_028981 [Acer saccharum]
MVPVDFIAVVQVANKAQQATSGPFDRQALGGFVCLHDIQCAPQTCDVFAHAIMPLGHVEQAGLQPSDDLILGLDVAVVGCALLVEQAAEVGYIILGLVEGLLCLLARHALERAEGHSIAAQR